MSKTMKLAAAVSLAAVFSACSPTSNSGVMSLPDMNVSVAVDPHPERNADDPVRNDIGRQFLVEHYEAEIQPAVLKAIAEHRPGGIVFWNPKDKVSGSGLREVIRRYAAQAASTGDQKGLLFSTDYEGGGLAYTSDSIPELNIQRFRKGMTGLVNPFWLERSMPQFGTELCQLHGQIMAQELTSIGINYPLTMVADLSTDLMAMRSVSKNPDRVSACLEAAMGAFFDNGHIVFVTKHFPGLGQVVQDTHSHTVVSPVSSMDEEAKHLKPFKKLIETSQAQKQPELLSILASHIEVPLFDPAHLTTESTKVLQGVMRNQLGFGGLVVSDAMWMGQYGKMSVPEMLPVYLTSFIAGMDLLMVRGVHFGPAVEFFRQVYDNEVSPEMRAACEQRSGLAWSEIRKTFIQRLKDSSQRLDTVVAKVGDPRDEMKDDVPRNETTALRSRYDQILMASDARWKTVLPSLRAQEDRLVNQASTFSARKARQVIP